MNKSILFFLFLFFMSALTKRILISKLDFKFDVNDLNSRHNF